MRDFLTVVFLVIGMASLWLASPTAVVMAAYWWGGASLPFSVAVWSAVKVFMGMIGTAAVSLFLAFVVVDGKRNKNFTVSHKTNNLH